MGSATLVLAGVSTDCCVLSTAVAAADVGVPVQVVADACAGVDDASHRKTLDVLALYARSWRSCRAPTCCRDPVPG